MATLAAAHSAHAILVMNDPAILALVGLTVDEHDVKLQVVRNDAKRYVNKDMARYDTINDI